MKQKKVVKGGIENIEIEMHRNTLRADLPKPCQNWRVACLQFFRAEMAQPMLSNEAGLKRCGLGQADIKDLAGLERPPDGLHEVRVVNPHSSRRQCQESGR